MSKKTYAAFVPLLAVAAFAVMPAVAQAQPHWYSCEASSKGKFEDTKCTKAAPPEDFEWVRIPAGVPVKVTSTSSPTLTLAAAGLTLTCTVKDKGTIENPAGGGAGTDEITEFVNEKCKGCPTEPTEIIALGLPWHSVLLAGPPIRDEIKGIKIEIKCGGAKLDEFFGSLTPSIGSSTAVFGAGSGELEDAKGNKGTVTGTDDLEGPRGDRGITAKNP